jgi:hypothetical protein
MPPVSDLGVFSFLRGLLTASVSGLFDDFEKKFTAQGGIPLEAGLRFPFVSAAPLVSAPRFPGFARLVPRNARELFTQPSLWRLFTKSSFANIYITAPCVLRLASF